MRRTQDSLQSVPGTYWAHLTRTPTYICPEVLGTGVSEWVQVSTKMCSAGHPGARPGHLWECKLASWWARIYKSLRPLVATIHLSRFFLSPSPTSTLG